jgi:hypothetical protein
MTEKERLEKNLRATNVRDWNQQILKVRLFDNLIYNIDRNLGNLLITKDWKIFMIDHSRSFKSFDVLQHPKDLNRIATTLVEALRKLDEKALKEHCGKYLSSIEIRMLLKRRDKIVALIDTLMAEQPAAINR